MRRQVIWLTLLFAGCEVECRDYVAEAGLVCAYANLGQELVLENTGTLSPPVAMCRCPKQNTLQRGKP